MATYFSKTKMGIRVISIELFLAELYLGLFGSLEGPYEKKCQFLSLSSNLVLKSRNVKILAYILYGVGVQTEEFQ